MSGLSTLFRRRAIAIAACTLTSGLVVGVIAAPTVAAVPEHVATSVVGVGIDPYQQISGLSEMLGGHEAVDIATTGSSTIALLDDGSLVTTGSQWRLNSWVATLGTKKVVDLESSYSAAYAILDDGSAAMVDTYDQPYPIGAATAGRTITSISGGRHAAAGIDSNGDVVAWGDDSSGNITGLASAGIDGDAVQIDMGLEHGLALLDDGSVVGWGHAPSFAGAEEALGDSTVEKVVAGSYLSYALIDDGTVVVWGLNASDKSEAIATAAAGREVADIDVYFDDIVLSFADGTIAVASASAPATNGLVAATDGKRVLQLEVGESFTVALLADPTVSFAVLDGAVAGDIPDDVVVTTADRIRVTAGPYLGGTDYSIEWDGVEITDGTTADNGQVSEDIDIPDAALVGDHELSIVVDGEETASTVNVAAGVVSVIPTITGAMRVGETLTATKGKWSAGSTFSYSWLRDGKTISGATSATYTLKPTDLAKSIQVKVTGTRAGAATSKTSVKTSKVAKGTLNRGEVEIVGDLQVDRTLTLDLEGWDQAITKFSYQWYSNGAAIAKATRSTYVIPASHADKTISVRVTASATGYTSVTVQGQTNSFVERGNIHLAYYYFEGSPAVGKTLSVKKVPGAQETASLTRVYQWFVDGEPIVGATKSTLKLTSAFVGKYVSLRMYVARNGYYPNYSTISGGEIYAKSVTPGKVAVTGTAKVGNVLTVKITAVPEGVQTSTVWLKKKGSVETELAYGESTYTIAPADKGAQIYARVYFFKTGFAYLHVNSTLSKKVV